MQPNKRILLLICATSPRHPAQDWHQLGHLVNITYALAAKHLQVYYNPLKGRDKLGPYVLALKANLAQRLC